MALGFIGALFGRGLRLPRDRTTRLPRSVKRAVKAQAEALRQAVDEIGALPGLADIPQNKRVPRGFYDKVRRYHTGYDAYAEVVRKHLPILPDTKRPGEPGGCNPCFAAPMGVSGIETLNLYREVRPWRDFPKVGQRMAELGEAQFKTIQSRHTGKDPEKIRFGSKAVREGRLALARQKQPCPFLDVGKQRCRVWDHRPVVCRMHHPVSAPEMSDPAHAGYPQQVKAYNIRPPLKVQAALAQIDKRLGQLVSPFMYAGILQLVQVSEGQLIQEVGEAPVRMQQDGRVAGRANRNRPGSKKFKKKPKKRK